MSAILPVSKIVYKVWLPGQDALAFEPMIELHGIIGMRFFAQGAVIGRIFLDANFAIQAWEQGPDGQWASISVGVFKITRSGLEVETICESGRIAPGTTTGIITVMLTAALSPLQQARKGMREIAAQYIQQSQEANHGEAR